MKKIFVSGCYDIVHAGHVQFFREAKALGDHLTVCFASDEILWHHKERRSSLPEKHKHGLIAALDMVDDVVIGTNLELGLDFQDHFRQIRPDVLAVTEDDQYADLKIALCEEVGATYSKLPKTPPQFPPVSSSGIVKWIKAPDEAPLRVDFAGGWLDVPRHAREGGFIINCAITPMVSLREWNYEQRSGLGGSGAWALLNGQSGVQSEIALGVGWQDPAIIRETGLCVWRSGQLPDLCVKRDGTMLAGRMAVYFTGSQHDTPAMSEDERDYDMIVESSMLAAEGVEDQDIYKLAEGVKLYHKMQLKEGMEPLPPADGMLAHKYCGGGFGGYALYLFDDPAKREAFVENTEAARAVEPYLRPIS
jgi:cytidyltransferase-like protein